ncbi:MAG TPA: DNA topoisomerase IB [Usitatibacter sp.]|jgi:DNA topoisomerase-1|nr:DNA topoisomerase IB [Usitatibacter sp.]
MPPSRAVAPRRERRPVPVGGLRYATDREPGIRRLPARKGFAYENAAGKRVRDPQTLERIKHLAIPPAWTDVWICPDERGHLQATGRDARGRKQYRYHDRWRERRDADKFEHMIEFGRALPDIRARVKRDLAQQGLPRTKVLAALVELLERTCMRVGNERYAEENDSFGLTTLRNRHVKVKGARIEFQFKGKGGKFHRIALDDDPRLARIVRRCRELPGQELFQYLDESGETQCVGSDDVNEYLQEITGSGVTAKDFRTWNGTVYVANMLRACEAEVGLTHVAAAVREAARRLGNTPAICRKSYVHPRVLDPKTWAGRAHAVKRARRGLYADEAALLALLEPVRTASRRRRPPLPTRPSMSAPAGPT